MRIELKVFAPLLAIAALIGLVAWRTTVANEALRGDVEDLRRGSLQELLGAVDMLLTLGETQLSVRELVSTTARNRSARPGPEGSQRPAGAAAAIESGLGAFEEALEASRRATEATLAGAEQAGDTTAAARERQELSAWLDRLDDEIATHRWLLGQLTELASSDPDAAAQYANKRILPHYVDVVLPLVQGYHEAAERELREAIGALEAALGKSRRDTAVITGFALACALLLGLLAARHIARPIASLREAAERLEAGDLGARAPVTSTDELGVLAAAFNDIAQRLEVTTASKGYLDDIIRSMGEILLVTDPGGRVQTVNRAAVEQLGWSEVELIGRDVRDVIRSPGTKDGDAAGEAEVVTHDGTDLPVDCTPRDLRDRTGRSQGRIWVARDIRDRKQVEQELRRSLAEKEALLREVHHRVKNNLQVISSLLRLQVVDTSSADAVRMFHDSESRIRSMALIHEQLYRSRDLTRIDFREYVDGLTRNVLQSAGEVGRPVKLRLDVASVSLGLDVGVACGLILNELLSNAMKHAFPNGASGTITVAFHCADGHATLVVADDGVGLSETPAGQGQQHRSLGLRLVRALVGQLHGTASFDGEQGTRVTLTFPVSDTAPRAASLG